VRRAALTLAFTAALAGCGGQGDRDVAGFTQEAKDPAERAILGSIATYRTTEDDARACTLVTAKFVERRFEGEVDNCRQVLRTASRHLPDTAEVRSVSGGTARVFVDEPTATDSIYVMRREGGTWKIDDIVEDET
jgi:hypothetical protein